MTTAAAWRACSKISGSWALRSPRSSTWLARLSPRSRNQWARAGGSWASTQIGEAVGGATSGRQGRMIEPSCRVAQTGGDVLRFEVGILLEDFVLALAHRQEVEDIADPHPHPTDTG